MIARKNAFNLSFYHPKYRLHYQGNWHPSFDILLSN
jgi:hypothetical protein